MIARGERARALCASEAQDPLRVIALIDHPDVVRRILERLGRRSPAL